MSLESVQCTWIQVRLTSKLVSSSDHGIVHAKRRIRTSKVRLRKPLVTRGAATIFVNRERRRLCPGLRARGRSCRRRVAEVVVRRHHVDHYLRLDAILSELLPDTLDPVEIVRR